jgi:hypothetical protein
MFSADTINATFELLGGFFLLNHCRALWKSKEANGVSLLSTVFFALWGLWNVVYYPHLGQMLSFYAGLFIMFANTVWIVLIVYVRRLSADDKRGAPTNWRPNSTYDWFNTF